MKKNGAFAVFLVLLLSGGFGIDLSLAPGLSAKNLLLYVMVAWISLEAVLDGRDGGFFGRYHDYMSLHTAFLALLCVALLSSLASLLIVEYPGYSPVYAVMMLKTGGIDPYLMLFVFLAAVRDAKEALWMAKAMLIALSVTNFVGLIDMFQLIDLGIMTPRGDGRLQGPLGSSNEYGALMAFYIPLTFVFIYSARGLARTFWAFTALVFIGVLLFSTSRGALVGLVGGAVIGSLLAWRYIRMRYVVQALVIVSCVAGLAIAVLAVQYGDLLFERFVGVTTTGSAFDQTSGRTEIWGDALALMFEKPITMLVGFGWKTFLLLNPLASHNVYLEYFFELGVIGLMLIVTVYFSVVYLVMDALRSAAPEKRILLLGFLFGYLSFLISIVFGNLDTTSLFVWALTGVMLRLACVEKSTPPAREPLRRHLMVPSAPKY